MNKLECCCFMMIACLLMFMLYLKRCHKRAEAFDGTRRKYTLKDLACALQGIKTFLGKDEPDPSTVYLIEVKDVAFVGKTATIVCVAFNKRTYTTKMYKAVVEDGNVVTITDNMIQFDETFMEHQKFGSPQGIHDSEQFKNVPFMTSDIAKLSRYTFSKEIPKWKVEETPYIPPVRTSIAPNVDKDIDYQLAQIVANPEMRKYVTIQSLRNT